MNHYEEKMQAKKERLENKAIACEEKANSLSKAGWESLKSIPFGQPILVGHHSEKRDRAFRAGAVGKIYRSAQMQNKADHYASKAESVGKGGISSDDPDAVIKLIKKLEKLEEKQSMMKNVNKAIKSKKLTELEKIEAIMKEVGCEEKEATKFLNTPDCFGGIGFARYQLSNNNANIRSTKLRIKRLRAQAQMIEREDVKGEGWKLTENKEENRIRFIFEGKPEAETRSILKSRGFRWSPYNKAWQRMLNANGRYAAKYVIQELSK